jgi:FKBP-type peptidyl-prolyl cis-trans isomerase SlyD
METIDAECVVDVTYTMKTHLPDGTVKENHPEPFQFIFGVERQPSTIEAAIAGAKVGDKVSLCIPPSEIYGEYDPSLIREIPKKGLIKQRLKEGQFYRQMRKGALVSFKVVEIRLDKVLADFNKPLAGISVSIDLEVTGIREATKEEIDAALDSQIKRSIGCG